jgi:hypothetical protein
MRLDKPSIKKSLLLTACGFSRSSLGFHANKIQCQIVQSPLDFIFVRDFHGVSSYIAVARAVHRDPTATVFTRAACLLDPDDVSLATKTSPPPPLVRVVLPNVAVPPKYPAQPPEF